LILWLLQVVVAVVAKMLVRAALVVSEPLRACSQQWEHRCQSLWAQVALSRPSYQRVGLTA
jgi:hypothetical protein